MLEQLGVQRQKLNRQAKKKAQKNWPKLHTLYKKNNSKCMRDLNVKPQRLKEKKNVGKKSAGCRARQRVLRLSIKTRILIRKIDNSDFITIQAFLLWKRLLSGWKKQETEWETMIIKGYSLKYRKNFQNSTINPPLENEIAPVRTAKIKASGNTEGRWGGKPGHPHTVGGDVKRPSHLGKQPGIFL